MPSLGARARGISVRNRTIASFAIHGRLLVACFMDRRNTDGIEQRIRQWEETRDGLGSDAPYTLVRYINDEIDRLRHEKLMRARPKPGGRRATDPRLAPPATPIQPA